MQPARPAQLARRVPKVSPDRKALRVRMGLRELTVSMVRRAKPARKVCQVRKVPLAQMVPQAKLAPLAPLVRPARKDLLVPTVLLHQASAQPQTMHRRGAWSRIVCWARCISLRAM